MGRDIAAWLEAHRVDASALSVEEIVGAEHALTELRSVVGRLRHPEMVTAAGGELPRGIVLWGRPGVGKTTCTRWLARQIGDALPVYEIAADELTPTRVRALFRAVNATRSVIAIDELDAVALHRDWLDAAAGGVLRALLAALDGLTGVQGPLVVGATTRAIDELDRALLRSGRLGVHIRLEAPTSDERRRLLEGWAAHRPCEPAIDWTAIADATEGWTPADLRAALDDALGLALADERTLIADSDVRRAVGRHGEVTPPEPPAPVLEPAEIQRQAVHEAGHCAAAVALAGAASVTRVEVGWANQTHVSLPGHRRTGSELAERAAVALAGSMAEEILLGEATDGGGIDLHLAMQLVERRIEIGLEPDLPPVDLTTLLAHSVWFGDQWARVVARRAEEARMTARQLITASAAAVQRFAATLAAEGTLEGEALALAIAAAGFVPLPAPVETGGAGHASWLGPTETQESEPAVFVARPDGRDDHAAATYEEDRP